MKKIVGTILSIIFVLGLSVSAATTEENIDELLAPYKVVIDKVNTELGSAFYIPDKNKEKVYNNIKNMTPDEVEAMLREDYKTLDPSHKIESTSKSYKRSYATGKKSEPSFIPNFSGSIQLVPLN